MRYTARLVAAAVLSVLIHIGIVAYMSQKPLNAFGVSPSSAREEQMEVHLVQDLPLSDLDSGRDMDHLIREENIKRILEEQAKQPPEEIPEPEADPDWEVAGADTPAPPVEDVVPLREPDRREIEEGASEVELLNIPLPRVEAPNPESRVWTAVAPKPLPSLAESDEDDRAPEPPPLTEANEEDRTEPELPEIEETVLEFDSLSDPIELPEGALVARTEPLTPDSIPLPGGRRPVTNWDDFLQVKIQTYRPDSEPGYFRVTVSPNEKAKDALHAMRKDVLIALDASGSMDPERFERLKQAVIESLSKLRKGDRFNVIGFKADVVALNPGLWPVREETIEKARGFISGMTPSGKTDMYRSLSRLARSLPPGDRPFVIVLISDGMPTVGVKNSRELINQLTVENNRRASIHVLGVGGLKNRYLLEFLAYLNKGSVRFCETAEQVPGTVESLFNEVQDPILMDIVADLSGFPGQDSYPEILPDLFRGGSLRLYGRFDREKELVLRLAGSVRGRPKDFVYRGSLPDKASGNPAIAREWAAKKSYELVAENCEKGDSPARLSLIRGLVGEYALDLPSNY